MNDADKAGQWTTITRICDCGCNSYDLKVPKESGLRPLIPASQRGGCVFSMQFNLSNRPGTIEIDIFRFSPVEVEPLPLQANAA